MAQSYFNPRSPRGERPARGYMSSAGVAISIHAPRGGSDYDTSASDYGLAIFQSTLPAGGATTEYSTTLKLAQISIHAPRGGSDAHHGVVAIGEEISIHAPRGGSDLSG